ncbi:MAG: triphosphoribosyl-dephospho-CoA synthase [Rhodopirellula sp. JB053]
MSRPSGDGHGDFPSGFHSDHTWRLLASSLSSRSDAIRMACVLEATAPKVGNVHPGACFDDLTFEDFVIAAGVTADAMGRLRGVEEIGDAVWAAVAGSVRATTTNVNLGIVLLLAPLLASEPDWDAVSESNPEVAWSTENRLRHWQASVERLLERIDLQQGAMIAKAISGASAGGLDADSLDDGLIHEGALGKDRSLDVNRENNGSYDILAAMRLAMDRDRIARQYAEGYRDLFEVVVPTIQDRVTRTGDVLTGIVNAHITLIAGEGDSLIARKGGQAASRKAAGWARDCLAAINGSDGVQVAKQIQTLDRQLRSDGNRLNPGTSADLIAAALFVLLRVV